MAKKRKIDLNVLSIITTVIFFAISIIATYQMFSYQKNMDLLKLQYENLEKEKINLEAEIDPAWHSKFNNQKGYYESQLTVKDKDLLKIKHEKDSIEFFANTFKKLSNGDYAIKKEALKKVVLSFVQNREADELIKADSALIDNLKKLRYNQDQIIKNYEIMVKQKDEIIMLFKERERKTSNSSLISLIVSLIGGLVGILFFKNRKSTP
jgi:hypothetical protein